MKKITFILTATFLITAGSVFAQDDAAVTKILKLNGSYIIHWFEGEAVHLVGAGPELELALSEKTSTSFALYYNIRVDDPTNKPQIYTDVIYFTWSGRWYSKEVLDGFYGGILVGIGKPTTTAMTGDLGVQAGYQVLDGKFSYEFGIQAGYGLLRNKTYYNNEPLYETVWGFYTRPYLSIGFGF